MGLQFKVKNQKLERVDDFFAVEKSQEYLKLSVSFETKDWDNATRKFAVFSNKHHNDTLPYSPALAVELENGECYIPSEILASSTDFKVNFVGTDEDKLVITTNALLIDLKPTGAVGGVHPKANDSILLFEIEKEVKKSYSKSKLEFKEELNKLILTLTDNEGNDTNLEVILPKGYGSSNITTKVYTFEDFLGSNWLRIAKVEDILKNSSGKFYINTYGVKEDSTEVKLTSSIFNITCGLNHKGQFVSDFLPINQAPELAIGSGIGSDIGSGGESGSDDVSSASEEIALINEVEVVSDTGEVSSGEPGSEGGSGSSIYGLASITVERYEGEMYICALMNFPATSIYKGLKIDLCIENNLNFKMLEQFEIVDLTDVNEEEMQVLEGMTLKSNIDYEWRISCNLQKYMDGLNSGKKINIRLKTAVEESDTTLLSYFYDSTSDIGTIAINHGDSTYWNGSYKYPYDLFDYSTGVNDKCSFIDMGGVLQGNVNTDDMLDTFNRYYKALTAHPSYLKPRIKRISGTITFDFSNTGGSAEVFLNGEKVFEEEGALQTFEYHFENLEVGKDLLEVINSGGPSTIFFKIDAVNTEIELSIPYKASKEKVIDYYTIENNDIYDFQLKIAELIKHYTTDSYDLYSVYNKLESLNNEMVRLQDFTGLTHDIATRGLTQANIAYDKAEQALNKVANHPAIINQYDIKTEYIEGVETEGVVRLNNNLRAVNLSKDKTIPIMHLFFDGTIKDWLNVRFTSGETLNDTSSTDRKNTPFYNNSKAFTHFYCIQGNEFKELVNLKIPKDITEIPSLAFQYFNSLESIYIPKNITRICYLGIVGDTTATKLKELIFEEGSDVLIEARGFVNLEVSDKVVLPTRMTSVYNGGAVSIGYLRCKNLYLGEKLKATRYDSSGAIAGGHTMFGTSSGYTNLYLNCSIEDWISSKLTVPQESPLYRLRRYEEEEVGKVYVKNTDGEYEELTEFVIPETAIDSYRFVGIGAKLTLPQTIETVLDEQFMRSGVYFEVLPSSCIKVSKYGFEFCDKLIKVNTNNAIVHLMAFYACKNLKKLVIPQGIYYASSDSLSFSGMDSLEVLDIAGNANNTFENFRFGRLRESPLKSLVIRATKLINLTVGNDYSLREDVKIYITDEILETYKSATNWSKYADQMYPLSEYIEEEI